jgi:multiple sugar transport system ATP-binding protein
VTHEEYLGSERVVYGALDGGPFDGKKVISRMPSTLVARYEPGTVHAFAVTERHLKLYDRATGKRTAGRPPREVWR